MFDRKTAPPEPRRSRLSARPRRSEIALRYEAVKTSLLRFALPCLLAVALLTTASRARAKPPVLVPQADPRAEAARAAYLHDRDNLMFTLGVWSAGSTVIGIPMTMQDSPAVRAAGIQSIAWGVVGGVVTGLALAQGSSARRIVGTEAYWLKERKKLRNIFLVTAALDVAYLAVGSALWAASTKPELRGTGAGIMLQGGFLLVFDGLGGFAMGAP